jgi:hypothetical protein
VDYYDREETLAMTVTEKVSRGLAWLREHGAGYGLDLDQVDLSILDIGSSEDCVLGQAWTGPESWSETSYGQAMDRIHPDRHNSGWDAQQASTWAWAHGFLAAHWGESTSLTDEWCEQLRAARMG